MRDKEKQKASHVRQEMNARWTEMRRMLDEFMEREPLVKGTLYERRRRCGREGCRCGRGQPHLSLAFSWSEAGQTKHVSLRDLEPERLRPAVESYRRFRTARAQLGKTCHALLKLVDEMETLRKVEWNSFFNGTVNRASHEDD